MAHVDFSQCSSRMKRFKNQFLRLFNYVNVEKIETMLFLVGLKSNGGNQMDFWQFDWIEIKSKLGG